MFESTKTPRTAIEPPNSLQHAPYTTATATQFKLITPNSLKCVAASKCACSKRPGTLCKSVCFCVAWFWYWISCGLSEWIGRSGHQWFNKFDFGLGRCLGYTLLARLRVHKVFLYAECLRMLLPNATRFAHWFDLTFSSFWVFFPANPKVTMAVNFMLERISYLLWEGCTPGEGWLMMLWKYVLNEGRGLNWTIK